MSRISPLRAALLGGIALAVAPAFAQQAHDHAQTGTPPAPAALGEVTFPVTCTPEAQAAFNDAMKLQHSFWYQAAGEAFRRVRERDPNCVMAYWGEALTKLINPFTPPTQANLTAAHALMEEARRLGARSEREAGFIEALSVLFAADDLQGHRARWAQYAQAMERLHSRFPGDSEVGIFYALSLVVTAAPTDKTYANQLRAGEILAREFVRQPQHPGVAHYLIHTYDTPALAARGVPAAERYAGIAPDSPHALHMPSHIFTRVGRWDDSIATNLRSAEVARAREETFDEVHALDYIVYAYLQTGRPQAAQLVVSELRRFDSWRAPTPIGYYALAAMPARNALERGAWDEAASLPTRRFGAPFVDAVTFFARASGAARAGRPDAAETDLAALREAAAALQGRDPYWHEQVEIQRVAAEGWIAFARGQRDEGLAKLREAAEREGRTDKHPVTPGPLAPAREQLAEMLWQMERFAEAQRDFEAVQQTEPRRLRAVAGAMRAAERAGDGDAAKRHAALLVALTVQADTASPDVERARAIVTR